MQNHKLKLVLGVLLMALASTVWAQKDGNSAVLSTVSGDHQVESGELVRGGGTPGAGLVTDGTESWDAQGSPNNVVMELDIGASNAVTGGSFDVTITTSGNGSWCSEATLLMTNSDGIADPNGIILSPAAGNDATCDGGLEVSSGGVLDFTDNGLPDIVPNADGILRLEFFESFDDVADEIDAFWGTHSAPALVQGVGLACTDQAACDAAVGGGGPGPGEFTAVPTLGTWGLIALGLAVLMLAGFMLRSRTTA